MSVRIERRLRSLEQRVKGGRLFAPADHTADYLGNAIASALSRVIAFAETVR
jgi:hypothetical protein